MLWDTVYITSLRKYGFYILTVLIMIPFFSCNISYEDVPDNRPTGLHPSLPPFGTIYHGSNYRFPFGSCDESQCHFNDLTGGNSGSPSCYSCHDGLWSVFYVSHTLKVSGRYHHYAVDDGNFTSVCGVNMCHGDGSALYTENLTGYNYRYSCYACHNPIPPPGHRISKEGVLHHKDIGKDPAIYCYESDCHGSTEPGGVCSRCHDSDYPTDD